MQAGYNSLVMSNTEPASPEMFFKAWRSDKKTAGVFVSVDYFGGHA